MIIPSQESGLHIRTSNKSTWNPGVNLCTCLISKSTNRSQAAKANPLPLRLPWTTSFYRSSTWIVKRSWTLRIQWISTCSPKRRFRLSPTAPIRTRNTMRRVCVTTAITCMGAQTKLKTVSTLTDKYTLVVSATNAITTSYTTRLSFSSPTPREASRTQMSCISRYLRTRIKKRLMS